MKRLSLILLISIVAVGCASNTLYQWGQYEDFLYQRYLKPGKITPQQEITALEAHLEKTYAKELLPPPGLHAHLGYLYLSEGQQNRAVEHFHIEKKLFPESSTFINGLIKRINQ
ncbi:MAG: DUF4810 domain-containing protein [Candidatus Magnetomorum sp.]|nr:DUF4810 domain-containing protein [Candidatus Magnetomorum sp.]